MQDVSDRIAKGQFWMLSTAYAPDVISDRLLRTGGPHLVFHGGGPPEQVQQAGAAEQSACTRRHRAAQPATRTGAFSRPPPPKPICPAPKEDLDKFTRDVMDWAQSEAVARHPDMQLPDHLADLDGWTVKVSSLPVMHCLCCGKH